MRRIEFVRIKSNFEGLGGPVKGIKYEYFEIEDIVRKYLENGWDFQGFIPITVRATGETETISLIFTKPED